MTPEIKQRIQQIRQGKTPKGYCRDQGIIYPISWRIKKLEEIGEARNGFNYRDTLFGYKVCVLGVGDFKMQSKMKDFNSVSTITVDVLPVDELYIMDNDIVFVRSNGSKELVGRNLLVFPGDKKITFSGFCIRFRLFDDKNSSMFINYHFDNGILLQKLHGEAQGSNINNLNQKILNSLILPLPPLPEQTAIAEILSTQDRVIELKEQLLAEKKRQKKYLMQQLLTGKMRLKGFKGEWKRKRIIDICDYVDYRGKTPNKTKSGIFLVTAKNVKEGYIDYEVSKEYISKDDYEEVMHRGKPAIGDILITTEAPCGNVAQVDRTNIALAQRIIKYCGHSQTVNNTYLKYYFLSPQFQSCLNMNSSGGTVQGIKGSTLHHQIVCLPSLPAQTAIAEILSTADREIDLLGQSIEAEKRKKKSLMQLLLTGIVRVGGVL